MKYYQLTKDLPTFKKGTIFWMDNYGSLVSNGSNIVAYTGSTIKKFPNILEDWFVEVSEPDRDQKTKEAFIDYLDEHKDERFFQAIRNFAREYLGDDFRFIYSCKRPIDTFDRYHDTFYLKCDELHEMKEDTE